MGANFLSMTQRDDRVAVVIDTGNGCETIEARWLIACDGARSAVRKQAGIQLDDLDFEEPWLVVDAEVDGPIQFPNFPACRSVRTCSGCR